VTKFITTDFDSGNDTNSSTNNKTHPMQLIAPEKFYKDKSAIINENVAHSLEKALPKYL
jgi:SLT domain-containing protein